MRKTFYQDSAVKQKTCSPFLLSQLHFKRSSFQYPSSKRIQQISLPTLFISGLADTLIPPSMMQHLYDVSLCTIGQQQMSISFYCENCEDRGREQMLCVADMMEWRWN